MALLLKPDSVSKAASRSFPAAARAKQEIEQYDFVVSNGKNYVLDGNVMGVEHSYVKGEVCARTQYAELFYVGLDVSGMWLGEDIKMARSCSIVKSCLLPFVQL